MRLAYPWSICPWTGSSRFHLTVKRTRSAPRLQADWISRAEVESSIPAEPGHSQFGVRLTPRSCWATGGDAFSALLLAIASWAKTPVALRQSAIAAQSSGTRNLITDECIGLLAGAPPPLEAWGGHPCPELSQAGHPCPSCIVPKRGGPYICNSPHSCCG